MFTDMIYFRSLTLNFSLNVIGMQLQDLTLGAGTDISVWMGEWVDAMHYMCKAPWIKGAT